MFNTHKICLKEMYIFGKKKKKNENTLKGTKSSNEKNT